MDPRTRGDGPGSSTTHGLVSAVSPHTRGWTLATGPLLAPDPGFPAHAGMDPCTREVSCSAARFPRTRGDGPARGDRGVHAGAVSPHTRGWTRYLQCTAPSSSGFPAHAGMDPSLPLMRSIAAWFPRTRGDGPAWGDSWADTLPVSPHTRGWTEGSGRPGKHEGGFPAHAGMDPCMCSCRRRTAWFPRTRGDGPGSTGAREALAAVSPHTRGWTRDGPGRLTTQPPVGAVSPHTRGWTPLHVDVPRADAGFPAHAGMDPAYGANGRGRDGFPRTRGDGPQCFELNTGARKVSPHTRGWTQLVLSGHPRLAGFPAHAGMDPRGLTWPCMRCGFPRTRGDGPRCHFAAVSSSRVSPHTRGWTPVSVRVQPQQLGFPAHAGMDRG